MKFLFFGVIALLQLPVKAQSVESIKTDAQCLEFIRKNLDGYQNFVFDTVFTTAEVKMLKLPYKNWGVFDFNNDKIADLFFIGTRKNYMGYDVNLYLSDKKSYKLVYLTRSTGRLYDPLVFTENKLGKSLLFVYLFDIDNHTIVDSLMQLRSHKYPNGIRFVDTLVYAHDNVINFAKQKSKLAFDSITFKLEYDSIVVYSNGSARYLFTRLDSVEFEEPIKINASDFNTLKKLVGEIDLETTSRHHLAFGTDRITVYLRIYTNGKYIDFWDYGKESTFTLKAIYKIFELFDPFIL